MAKGNLILPRRNSIIGCSLTSYPGKIIVFVIIMICIWYTLMSYIVCLSIGGDIFLSFDNNKLLQISSTFLRILAECNNTVFCNSTILVFIPISFSRFVNLDGVLPSASMITCMIFTLLFHNFFSFLAKSWYFSIFSFSFSSTLVSCGRAKSIIWHLLPFFSTMIISGRLASIILSVCIESPTGFCTLHFCILLVAHVHTICFPFKTIVLTYLPMYFLSHPVVLASILFLCRLSVFT